MSAELLRIYEGAACRGEPTEQWYPEEDSKQRGWKKRLRQRTDFALSFCLECPVIEPCREWGIAHEAFGIWGGLTPRARVLERRLRGVTLVTAPPSISPSAYPREESHPAPTCYVERYPHGDNRRYNSGCRCDDCRSAHAEHRREYRQLLKSGAYG